jgi:acetylglutamate kinase
MSKELARYRGKGVLVKIGGSTLGSHDTALEDLVALQKEGIGPVVVHGGGQMITQWMEMHAIPTRFVEGLRVTDAQALQVAIAVLAGWVNTEIAASLQRLGGRALGLSGTDGGMILARARDPALGYVGEVERVDPGPIRLALQGGYIPVIAPAALDDRGQPLNINADTMAGEVAAALGVEALLFLTDMPGVCDEQGSTISTLDAAGAAALRERGVISGGMIPKVEACLKAGPRVGEARIIDGRRPHALLEALRGLQGGTRIV